MDKGYYPICRGKDRGILWSNQVNCISKAAKMCWRGGSVYSYAEGLLVPV